MERADQQLPRDLRDPLPGHRDPPVVRAVIDHEQLSSATDKYKKEKRFTDNEDNSLARRWIDQPPTLRESPR